MTRWPRPAPGALRLVNPPVNKALAEVKAGLPSSRSS
ncbi:MAG: hypothetical protein CISAcid_00630 [uncultured Acidilobus sp. CIS]|nr:MAG: hypothetical protein CISAcid_00630 [uncultured Acidilobus sp. CIS]